MGEVGNDSRGHTGTSLESGNTLSFDLGITDSGTSICKNSSPSTLTCALYCMCIMLSLKKEFNPPDTRIFGFF